MNNDTLPAAVELSCLTAVRDIRFEYSEEKSYFYHNLKRDLHIFCIWEKARHMEDAIIDLVKSRFRLIRSYEIEWDAKEVEGNFSRFYKTVGYDINRKHETAGSGPFLCLIVEDSSPEYYYHQSVSGSMELCNRRIVELKKTVRDWLGGFLVHSTGNPIEFIEQANLLFSSGEIASFLSSDQYMHCGPRLKRSLTGSGGWNSFEDLFRYLNKTTDYVVLRNFESITGHYAENDLDVLCSDPDAFLAAANGVEANRTRSVAKCTILVGGQKIPVDVRFIGDGYYDSVWQKDILRESQMYGEYVRIPRTDHYFFSLLYHGVLQKASLNSKYVPRLQELGAKIGISTKLLDGISSGSSAAEILRGYLKSNNYSYYTPLDSGVHVNRRSLAALWPNYVKVYKKTAQQLGRIISGELA